LRKFSVTPADRGYLCNALAPYPWSCSVSWCLAVGWGWRKRISAPEGWRRAFSHC